MAEAKTLTYTVTPAQFDKVSRDLQAKGFKTNGNSGEVKEFGADVKFLYDSSLGSLQVTVLSAPYFHNMDAFCQQMDAAVKVELAS